MKGNILIVDDNRDNLRVLEGILAADGHEVRAATSGEIALKAIAARPPELIFLDVMMPGIDGLEVCRRLKENPATASIPVLFISALAETEEKLRAFDAGGVDYITKPFAEKEVLARVRIHLRLYRMDLSLQTEVRRATAKLNQLNRELEQRVVERTNQLEAANADLRQLARQLEDAYNELKSTQSRLLQQDKLASIGQLAAGVAHEINNPMGFIISNLGSLGRYVEKVIAFLDDNELYFAGCEPAVQEYLLQERKRHKIDQIRADLPDLIGESLEGAERVRKIVQDLKSFSHVDQAEYASADLNEGLESTLSIVWNELKYKATVEKEYGALPKVWCNLGQLNQVFMNLLVNAAQAIETKGAIRIKTWLEGDSVRIAISDTGAGIPKNTLSHIFDPFFTTKEVGTGTGLGLAIAYDIVVNKHGGKISVTSEAGAGSTFTIEIPVKNGQVMDRDPTQITQAL